MAKCEIDIPTYTIKNVDVIFSLMQIKSIETKIDNYHVMIETGNLMDFTDKGLEMLSENIYLSLLTFKPNHEYECK